jgi:hypothetical protein
MNHNLISKIKAKMMAGAQSSADKIEEAARTGRLHIGILAERKKLHRFQADLGKAAFTALEEDSPESLKNNEEAGRLINDIKLTSKKIKDLEKCLKADASTGKSC